MKQGCHVNGKALRHSWTNDDRVILALLFRIYDNSEDQRLKLWNYINKDKLTEEGYPSTGLPLTAMRAQKTDMKSGGVGAEAWNSVMDISLSEARRSFAVHRESVEEAAQHLRIQLRLRLATPNEDPPPIQKSTTLKAGTSKSVLPKPAQRIAIAQADEWGTSSSNEDDHNQPSPCVRRKKTLNPTLIRSFAFDAGSQFPPSAGLSTVSSSIRQIDEKLDRGRPQDRPSLVTKNLSSPGTPRQPTLLFRTFLPGHGFIARKFLSNRKKPPPPPPMRSETFLEKVDPHLRDYLPENAKYPSPFLSLTESPGRALELVRKKQLPHSLAIFETNAISKDGKARYGDNCTPYPYLVPGICRIHELDDLPGNYTGGGEFLVWGSIECQPIAVLENNKAKQLHRVMTAVKRFGRIGWKSGEQVGPSLALIPDKWKETIAYKLIRNFKVKGYLNGAKGKDYHEFIDAVYEASRGNRAASVFGEGAEITSPKTRIVVEIPAPFRPQSKKDKKKAWDIEWQAIAGDQPERQVSVAVPKMTSMISAAETPSSSSSDGGDSVQKMLDAQLQSDATDYGIKVNRSSSMSTEPVTPPSLFMQEILNQAALPTPPQIPPADYNSSPVEPAAEANTNSDTMVIDLHEDGDDDEEDEQDEIRELPTFDLTGDDGDRNEDENCAIIGTGRRGRGGHGALSIRSRSLSTALNTPTKAAKRGGRRKISTR